MSEHDESPSVLFGALVTDLRPNTTTERRTLGAVSRQQAVALAFAVIGSIVCVLIVLG